ncbi:CcdC family protein [Pullulanibacillus pueri]|uniref:CcdC family protein n=1 Tax=Pullulanibacillus pueri TaxID=1437324 RepID=UPI001E311BDE|nr:cytochrome c biogenesis protein CcdC [Pullulanibacillus pueri]
MEILSVFIGVLFAVSIIIVRLKASNQPTNIKKILLPPVFMSTGFLMFIAPQVRVSWVELIEAFLVGVLFSFFLIKTSKFSVQNGEIYLKRSKAFIFILIGLLIIRTLLKIFLENEISIDIPQTSGLFFTLAFGMILPWRIAMFLMYKRFEKKIEDGEIIST